MKEKIYRLIKSLFIRRKRMIVILLLLVTVGFFVYDYNNYTIDIGDVDEIAYIRIDEPVGGDYHIIWNEESIKTFVDSLNGKKLSSDGVAWVGGKAHKISICDSDDNIIYRFWTYGGNSIIVSWGIFYVYYDGDIDIDIDMIIRNAK